MKEVNKGILDNDIVISAENIQKIGEVIALTCIKTVIVRSGKELHYLYKQETRRRLYSKYGKPTAIGSACFCCSDNYLGKQYACHTMNTVNLDERITAESETMLDDEQQSYRVSGTNERCDCPSTV